MKARRLIYWLIERPTQRHREIALRLEAIGHSLQTFGSLNPLVAALQSRRSAIVVIEDDSDPRTVEKAILSLATLPELAGARFVLSLQRHEPKLLQLAAWSSFRDCIPLDLPIEEWMTRFLFATGGDGLTYRMPAPQVGIGTIVPLTTPGRLIWVSEGRMRIETRLHPPVGTNLSIGGSLAEAMRLRGLAITVEEIHNHRLMHRFSNAIVASWRVPDASRPQALTVLERLRGADPGPRHRIFVAIGSAQQRNEVLAALDHPRFELKAALQKQGIVNEPKFFGPDLVIIESSLCIEGGGQRFEQMMSNIDPQVPIVILGDGVNRKTIEPWTAKHPVLWISRVPPNLAELILEDYLTPRAGAVPGSDPNAAHLQPEDPFSYVTLSFPIRLASLHPLAGQVHLPFGVGNYGLYRLDSPFVRQILGRYPYIKLADTYVAPKPVQDTHPHAADFYICNVDGPSRTKLAAALTSYVSDQFRAAAGQPTQSVQTSTQHGTPPGPTDLDNQSIAQIVRLEPPVSPRGDAWSKSPSPDPSPAVATATDGTAAKLEPTKEIHPPDPKIRIDEVERPAILEGILVSLGEAWREVWNLLSSPGVRYVLIFCAVTAFAATLFWGVANRLAPMYEKSGGQYNESLRRFAPNNQGWRSNKAPAPTP